MLYGLGTAKLFFFAVIFVLNLRSISASSSAINKPAQLSGYQSSPQLTPAQSDRPIKDQATWSAQVFRIDHSDGMTFCKRDQIVDCLHGQKMVGS